LLNLAFLKKIIFELNYMNWLNISMGCLLHDILFGLLFELFFMLRVASFDVVLLCFVVVLEQSRWVLSSGKVASKAEQQSIFDEYFFLLLPIKYDMGCSFSTFIAKKNMLTIFVVHGALFKNYIIKSVGFIHYNQISYLHLEFFFLLWKRLHYLSIIFLF
jgi:hypothetical protein